MSDNKDHTPQGGVHRRDFLKTSAVAAGAIGLAASPALGHPKPRRRMSTKTLVVVFQFGGADALSLVAPVFDTTYQTVLRPTLRVGQPGEGTSLDGLALDGTFAMYPHLSSLHGLWTSGDLGIVHATGYAPPNRSHFASQDIYAKGKTSDYLSAEGWCNRLAQATSQGPADPLVRVLGLGSTTIPECLVGSAVTHSVKSLGDLTFEASDADLRPAFETMLSLSPSSGLTRTDGDLQRGAEGVIDLIDHFAGVDPSSYTPGNGANYPNSSLGRALEETAQLIKAGLGIEIFHVPSGGWDHHSNLANNLPTRATDLGDSIGAFVQDLGPTMMQDVVLVTMSEFGREALENASGGTDHGHAGSMFVVGGGTLGGQVHGTWPGVALADLDGGRFLAPANDYRDVLGDIFVQHLGLTPAEVATVFHGRTYTPVGIL